jgi:hypothetical protein
MPDLLTRSQRETELAAAIAPLFREMESRIIRDSRGVNWALWQAQLQQAMTAPLAKTHREAALQLTTRYHAPVTDEEMGATAMLLAMVQASDVAAVLTRSTAQSASTGILRAELGGTAIGDEIEATFGTSRYEGIAVTETTKAITQAERKAAQQIEDYRKRGEVPGLAGKLAPFWYTEKDGRVCEVCRPLHGKPKSEWGALAILIDGPPAHPKCRCWLTWKVVRQEEEVTA